jgi:hypothetical protein
VLFAYALGALESKRFQSNLQTRTKNLQAHRWPPCERCLFQKQSPATKGQRIKKRRRLRRITRRWPEIHQHHLPWIESVIGCPQHQPVCGLKRRGTAVDTPDKAGRGPGRIDHDPSAMGRAIIDVNQGLAHAMIQASCPSGNDVR